MIAPTERARSRIAALPAALTLLLLAAALTACRTLPPHLAPGAPPAPPCRAGTGPPVTIGYLGAGGFAIVAGSDALLTAPFYSNPRLSRVVLRLPIAPNESRIPGRPAWLAGVTVHGILVGHSHYDHLMDVPTVVRKWQLGSPVAYGSRTMAALLHSIAAHGGPHVQAQDVNTLAGTWSRPGTWVCMPGGCDPPHRPRFRAMALHSEHAPHLFGRKAFGGRLERPPDEPPRSAYDWPEGQTFAWLIDVLDPATGGPILRLHYQDAAASPPLGWPPRDLTRQRAVDVALLCAASFEEVVHYPEALVRELAPAYTIAGHWEDFFRDPRRPPVPVAGLDLPEFESRLRSALPAPPAGPPPYRVPAPGERIVCAP